MSSIKHIKSIRSYLEAGKSVCPFAARINTYYTGDTGNLRRAVAALNDYRAIVIVSENQLRNFDKSREWAISLFVRICEATAIVSYPNIDLGELSKSLVEIKKVLADDSNRIRPIIALYNRPVTAIHMGPIYSAEHPRFAPETILVLTWQDDVNSIGPLPRVRRAMERVYGYVYDAQALVLQLPVNRK